MYLASSSRIDPIMQVLGLVEASILGFHGGNNQVMISSDDENDIKAHRNNQNILRLAYQLINLNIGRPTQASQTRLAQLQQLCNSIDQELDRSAWRLPAGAGRGDGTDQGGRYRAGTAGGAGMTAITAPALEPLHAPTYQGLFDVFTHLWTRCDEASARAGRNAKNCAWPVEVRREFDILCTIDRCGRHCGCPCRHSGQAY